MFSWPELDLTDAERQFVRYYATGEYPGVLRRMYKVLLSNAAIEGVTQVNLLDKVQIARRARVFALTFAGDTSLWWLNIKTASGEQLTPPNPLAAVLVPPNPPGCLVSALITGTPWDGLAQTSYFPGSAVLGHDQWQNGPFLLEPNFVLVPNETLYFEGTPIIPAAHPEATVCLEIGIHVWEFPNMAGR